MIVDPFLETFYATKWAGRDTLRISESCVPYCEAKGSSLKGLEYKRIRIPWRKLALTVASSPYNKGQTKLIET